MMQGICSRIKEKLHYVRSFCFEVNVQQYSKEHQKKKRGLTFLLVHFTEKVPLTPFKASDFPAIHADTGTSSRITLSKRGECCSMMHSQSQ